MWSFDRVLKIIGRQALLSPLNLATVAALLPQDWEFTLVDRNVRPVTEAEWDRADLVLLSAMTAQREDFLALTREAKERGKRVAVGGPYPTTLPDEVAAAGADYLVLGEGEITIPPFLEALSSGATGGRFTPEDAFAAMTASPLPRFDLLDRAAYESLSVQFSRGCPFQCEFCDVTEIYGHRARAKIPAQVLAELDRLYDLGWDRGVFVVDDNFVGNRAQTRALLIALREWQRQRGHPFWFQTEASLDLAQEPELLELMRECRFTSVFVGIETPDTDSLRAARKWQNTRTSLEQAVETITRGGMRVMGSFILGFDGETAGAGKRISALIERAAIPTAHISLLQALPRTALWARLVREGRLLGEDARLNAGTLINFVPTRPAAEIAREYLDLVRNIYEPSRFLDRAARSFAAMPPAGIQVADRRSRSVGKRASDVRTFLRVLWHLGIKPSTRWQFWRHLWRLARRDRGAIREFISVCILIEQFQAFAGRLQEKIDTQLEQRPQTPPHQALVPSYSLNMPKNTRRVTP
jgi:radical SAM superfamily enzyme YgiQ (UPF0313 family)